MQSTHGYLLATPYINVGFVVVAGAPPLVFAVYWSSFKGLGLGPGLCVVLLLRQICWYEVCVNKEETSGLHHLCILLVPILFQIRPRLFCVLMIECPNDHCDWLPFAKSRKGKILVEAPAFSLDAGGNFLGLWERSSVLNSRCKSPFSQGSGNLMDFLWVPSGLQILRNWS